MVDRNFCQLPEQSARCLAGFYCPNNTAQPLYCCSGFYCPTPKEIYVCPSGYFCPTGTVSPLSWYESHPSRKLPLIFFTVDVSWDSAQRVLKISFVWDLCHCSRRFSWSFLSSSTLRIGGTGGRAAVTARAWPSSKPRAPPSCSMRSRTVWSIFSFKTWATLYRVVPPLCTVLQVYSELDGRVR